MSENEKIESYILVRVSQNVSEDNKPKRFPPSVIREAITDASKNYDIDVSHIMFNLGQDRDLLGRDVRLDFLTLKALLERTLSESRTATAAIANSRSRPLYTPPEKRYRRTPEEKEKAEHRARAMRAFYIWKNYTEKYPEKTPVETAPEGWFPFGFHANSDIPIEFSQATTQSGDPKWERPIQRSNKSQVEILARLEALGRIMVNESRWYSMVDMARAKTEKENWQ